MLRRLAAIAAAVVLLAAVPTGSLYVTTLPSGADVWIDGTYVGRSPLVLDALGAGRHTIGLTRSGWTSRQLDVSIVASRTTFSSIQLDMRQGSVRPLPGTIVILGLGVQATWIDGAPVRLAKDGSIVAPAGAHELSVLTRAGRITRSVQVWPETRTEVVLQPDVVPGRPSVVAPAEDYLPASAVRIAGDRIVVRYGGHEVVGRIGVTSYRVDGRSVDYDAGPTVIGTKVYLPLELLTLLSGSR